LKERLKREVSYQQVRLQKNKQLENSLNTEVSSGDSNEEIVNSNNQQISSNQGNVMNQIKPQSTYLQPLQSKQFQGNQKGLILQRNDSLNNRNFNFNSNNRGSNFSNYGDQNGRALNLAEKPRTLSRNDSSNNRYYNYNGNDDSPLEKNLNTFNKNERNFSNFGNRRGRTDNPAEKPRILQKNNSSNRYVQYNNNDNSPLRKNLSFSNFGNYY